MIGTRLPAVVLAAHGSGDGSSTNRRIEQLADELSEKHLNRFAVAYHFGSPSFRVAASRTSGEGAVVIPLMTSDGYYARKLRDEWAAGSESSRYLVAPPIGVTEAFRETVARMVTEARATNVDASDAVILVVGHGTRRVATSGDVAEGMRNVLATRFPEADVRTAFLDQEPTLLREAETLRDRKVLVVPLFLGGGTHTDEDLVTAFETSTSAPIYLPSVLEWPTLRRLVSDHLARVPVDALNDPQPVEAR